MRKLRTGSPQPEMWGVEDIANNLNITEMEAKKLFKEYHDKFGGGYGDIEKHLFLDFINEKQRTEREREARYNADIATAKTVTKLEEQIKALNEGFAYQIQTAKEQIQTAKEQIKTLENMSASSSADAKKARIQAFAANVVSIISMIIAIVSLVLNI